MAQGAVEAQSAGPVFLPVAVTKGEASGEDAASGDVAPASDAAIHQLVDNRIEIELGNGRLVRVGAGVDIGALKRVLDLLDGPATTGALPGRKHFS